MPSDRPKRPHGTFTPASTIGRVLTGAGYGAFHARRDTAFGGHRCHWDERQGLVRIGHWCGDDTPETDRETDRETERDHALTLYAQLLTSKGYRIVRTVTGSLYVAPTKET